MVIYSSLLTGCPVSGQTRIECAALSACQPSCANANTVIICPAVCIVDGCQCPRGTFINNETNSCVQPVGCAELCECTKEVELGLACLSLCLCLDTGISHSGFGVETSLLCNAVPGFASAQNLIAV